MTGMEIVGLDWRIRIAGMRLADCFFAWWGEEELRIGL